MGHCTRYCVELDDQPRMFSDCSKAPCGSSHPGLPGLPQKVLGLTASAVVINCVVSIGYCVDLCQPWTLDLQSQADIHDCWKMDITVVSTAWEQKELTRVTHIFYHKVQKHLPSSCDLSQAVQLCPWHWALVCGHSGNDMPWVWSCQILESEYPQMGITLLSPSAAVGSLPSANLWQVTGPQCFNNTSMVLSYLFLS